MESTPVLIIGAGPAGMALGISLAQLCIKSVILEKELEVAQDPRGVVLSGDAVRIMHSLGLDNDLCRIGHAMTDFQFHRSSFQNEPFHKIDLSADLLHQAVPSGILMRQPKLEEAMERAIHGSQFCDLRRGCTAESQQVLENGVIINYREKTGESSSIKCSWLIGADGKTGIVRKHFLEKQAGIRQEEGIFSYDGTWVAANFHINLPTPQSHPSLPFWEVGLTPQQVYDLYWPKGWHFCSPPGKPTASGRFGRHEDRLWRHEFAQDSRDDGQDAEVLLWEHITPMITRDKDDQGRLFRTGATTYPKDCIEILRCRPYSFVNKVVNKWFAGHTILIGDAAHVFPPFAGQGICSGVRDAHQLAWRLAAITRCNVTDMVAHDLLHAWAKERRQGVDYSAHLTEADGMLLNRPESLTSYVVRNMEEMRKRIPFVRQPDSPFASVEAKGYKSAKGGFFLPEFEGGGKFPQTAVASWTRQCILSDELLQRGGVASASLFTILSIQLDDTDAETQQNHVKALIDTTGLPQSVLDGNAVVMFDDTPQDRGSASVKRSDGPQIFAPLARSSSSATRFNWLQENKSFDGRLPSYARFAIVRPDFYIYAVCKDIEQLKEALRKLKEQF